MAKIGDKARQGQLLPTTPEELAVLSGAPPKPPAPPPVKPETLVPETLKGPQGELLTGMPPKPPAGPPTEIPLEMRGAQGELVTQQPAVKAPPAAVASPAAAPPPAVPVPPAIPPAAPGPVSGPSGPSVAELVEGEAEKPSAPNWLKKLGTVAKNTGRGILELVADFAHGYSGAEGPNVTEARVAREQEEKLQANERDFATKLQELQQQWQGAQATSRNAEELEQQRIAIEAQAAQAQAQREAVAQQAAADRASQERIAGIRGGGKASANPFERLLEQYRGGK